MNLQKKAKLNFSSSEESDNEPEESQIEEKKN